MSDVPLPPPQMKTRDVLKYGFATFLGLFTLFAIGTLAYAKNRRQARPAEEARRIEQRLQTYGDHGRIPAKTDPASPTAELP